MWPKGEQTMKAEGRNDYREGLFWLLGGAGFAIMGLAGFDEWHGIQSWYLYAWGVGLIIVMVMVAPRRHTKDMLRRGWLALIAGLVVSVVLAVASAKIPFAGTFSIITGLLWMGVGLWLMLRPGPASGGAGQ